MPVRVNEIPIAAAHPRSVGDPNAARIASEPCRRRSRSSARANTSPTLIRRWLLQGRRRNSRVPSANSRSTNCRVTPNRSAAPAGVTSRLGRRTTNCSPFARPSNISRTEAPKSLVGSTAAARRAALARASASGATNMLMERATVTMRKTTIISNNCNHYVSRAAFD